MSGEAHENHEAGRGKNSGAVAERVRVLEGQIRERDIEVEKLKLAAEAVRLEMESGVAKRLGELEGWRQGAEKDLAAKVEALDQWRAANTLPERLRAIETWRETLNEELPSTDRLHLRQMSQRLWSWTKAALIILGIFGIGTPVGVSLLLNSIGKKVGEVVKSGSEAEAKVKEALDKAVQKVAATTDVELRDLIKSEQLRTNVASEFTKEMRGELNREFREVFSTHAVGMIGGVKMYVEALSLHASEVPSSTRNPLILRELLYALGDLERAYGDDLAAATLEPQKKAALLYLVSGLYDRARGFGDRGREWFLEASRTDANMAEAYVLLADAQLEKVTYAGAGKWNNVEDLKKGLSFIELALAKFGARSSPSARYARCLEAGLVALDAPNGENVRAARTQAMEAGIEAINKAVAPEDSPLRRDPRCLFLLGQVYSGAYQDEPATDAYRIKAAEAFLKSFQTDTEFLRSLNNFIWWSTHDAKDAILLPLSVTGQLAGQDEDLFRAQLHVLEVHPLAMSDCSQLSTLAEGYAALCTKERKFGTVIEDAAKARIYADKALTLARLINYAHEARVFVDSASRVKERCAEALARPPGAGGR